MNRVLPALLTLCSGFLLGLAVQTQGVVRSSDAKESRGVERSEFAALKAEIETIKGKLPDQSHAMQDVSYHFGNLWAAADQKNWDLANFYLGETLSHLHWAVRIIPKRKDNAGREVNLEAILQAVENGPLTQLKMAIQSKDKARFAGAYRFTLEGCYSCHKASEKPFLRPQVPNHPETPIINFDPKASWPP